MSAATLAHVAALLSGVVIVLVVLWEAFETFVSPRRVARQLRLTSAFYNVSWIAWSTVGRLVRSTRRREGFLWVFGPLSLIMLLALWTVLIVAGFTLLQWGAGNGAETSSHVRGWWTDFYLSGLAPFTMTGDVSLETPAARVLTMLEAGTGLTMLAMVVGYLPLLSGAFSRREVNVLLLDAYAGSPPTAGEILLHYAENPKQEQLLRLLEQWKLWCAELLETQVSFPTLGYYRSQHANQSWLAALTAILDACAFVLTTPESEPSREARLTFAVARHTAVDLCLVLGLAPRPPTEDRLPDPELGKMRGALREAGLALSEGGEVDARLKKLRAMYEPYVNALGRLLVMPLPAWFDEQGTRENWRGLK
jgi:hypothetical protein